MKTDNRGTVERKQEEREISAYGEDITRMYIHVNGYPGL
jgi:hypothetical protein